MIVAAREGRIAASIVWDLANEHASLAAALYPMPLASALFSPSDEALTTGDEIAHRVLTTERDLLGPR